MQKYSQTEKSLKENVSLYQNPKKDLDAKSIVEIENKINSLR